jgi:hypothetical protein
MNRTPSHERTRHYREGCPRFATRGAVRGQNAYGGAASELDLRTRDNP